MLPYLFIAEIISLFTAAPAPDFKQQVIDDKVSIGYGIALGDVDGDKKIDILLADKKQIVWYRNGDWKKFVMAENLTELDNVCIAARDIDGDGKVEVAVGAQWNPGETSDSTKSGSVHYLVRPADPTGMWKQVRLRHEPTVHRMRWVKSGEKNYLVVLPLHGRNNKGGEGAGVRVYAYEYPKNPEGEWNMVLLYDQMHMTHNMEVKEENSGTLLYVAGKEGVRIVPAGKKMDHGRVRSTHLVQGAGEVRLGKQFIATIEPMHGSHVVVYPNNSKDRIVLDSAYHEGHALGAADFLGSGYDQVVAGWRNPDKEGNVGVKLFSKDDAGAWSAHWIDKNGMACEDLQIADLDGDGKKDIVASGRATNNLKIYWNRSR